MSVLQVTATAREQKMYEIKVEPLHPMILKSYRATVQGTDAKGVCDIEFGSLYHAASWAETCEIQDRVTLRNDSQDRDFGSPVVVQYRTNHLDWQATGSPAYEGKY
jgi:hypothetical protein